MTGRRLFTLAIIASCLLLCCEADGSFGLRRQLQYEIDCQLPHLPQNLNVLEPLAFDGEIHIQGDYLVSYNASSETMSYIPSSTEDHYVRVSVAAPLEVDVDIQIKQGQKKLRLSEIDPGFEEVIMTKAHGKTGKDEDDVIEVSLLFYPLNNGMESTCSALTVELSIIPVSTVKKRVKGLKCPKNGKDRVPRIKKGAMAYSTISDEGEQYSVTGEKELELSDETRDLYAPVRLISAVELELFEAGVDTFRITAFIGGHFATTGHVGLSLATKEHSEEMSKRKFINNDALLACRKDGSCEQAESYQKNGKVLDIIVPRGAYSLWIYEFFEEKMPVDLVECTPFTMSYSVEAQEKKRVDHACKGPRIPKDLNGPGLLGNYGFLSYNERVVVENLGGEAHEVVFTLETNSDVRFKASNGPGIDIDLFLKHRVELGDEPNGEDQQIAKSDSTPVRNTEGIVMYNLEAGQYVLRIVASAVKGVKSPNCPKFDLTMAVAPRGKDEKISGLDCTDADSPPNLTAVELALKETGMYKGAPNVYKYKKKGTDLAAELVWESTFVVYQETSFRVEVFSNFLLADMDVRLSHSRSTSQGIAVNGGSKLVAKLTPGEYKLQIWSGVTQFDKVKAPSYTKCMEYVMWVHAEEIEDKALPRDLKCGRFALLPPSFGSEYLLMRTGIARFHEDILVPFGSSSQVRMVVQIPPQEEIALLHLSALSGSLRVKAILQDQELQHEIDDDSGNIKETKDGIVATTGSAVMTKTAAMAATLKPKKMYAIEFIFSAKGTEIPDCPLANIQLLLLPDSRMKSAKNMPPIEVDLPQRLESTTADGDIILEPKEYVYALEESPFKSAVKFTVSKPMARLDVRLGYNLADAVLALRLHRVGTAEGSVPMMYGTQGMNHNQLTANVPAGDYEIVAYETTTSLSPKYVPFSFEVTLQADPNEHEDVCFHYLPPRNFDPVGYLSPLSGKSMHFQRDVLVNSRVGRSVTEFTLTEKSFFRAGTGTHPDVDVDIYLMKAVDPNDKEKSVSEDTIAFSDSSKEESMVEVLKPGKYEFHLLYYSMNDTKSNRASLPPCAVVPMEVAIMPLKAVNSDSRFTEQCPLIDVPESLSRGEDRSLTHYQRPITESYDGYHKAIAIEVTERSLLAVDLYSNFLLGGLVMSLSTMRRKFEDTDAQEYKVEIPAVSRNGMSFVRAPLRPGSYELTIRDPLPWGEKITDNKLQCTSFALSHILIPFTAPKSKKKDSKKKDSTKSADSVVQDDLEMCDSDFFPRSLAADAPGSELVGGPQDSEGTVIVHSNKFGVAHRSGNSVDGVNEMVMTFRVPAEKSVVRLFISPLDMDDSINGYIYKYVKDSYEEVFSYSSDAISVEKAFVVLDKDDEFPYELGIDYVAGGRSPCKQFEMGFGVLTESDFLSTVQCVEDKEVLPPKSISSNLHSDSYYVLTKSYMDKHTTNGVFEYSMEVHVTGDTHEVRAGITFDFMTADFQLLVRNNDQEIVAVGRYELLNGVTDNFRSLVTWLANEGTYTLYLTSAYNSDVMNDLTMDDNYCINFELDVSLMDTSSDVPHVIGVSPSGLDQASPSKSLILEMEFSDDVWEPYSEDSVVDQIDVRLRGLDGKVHPPLAAIFVSRKRLALNFGSMEAEKTFTLEYDASIFKTQDGTEFAKDDGLHQYVMGKASKKKPVKGGSSKPDSNADSDDKKEDKKEDKKDKKKEKKEEKITPADQPSCDCGEHGSCLDEGVCSCETPYTGTKCDECYDGYHMAQGACVRDIKCTTDTCNGHGKCDSSHGFPTCVCESGYATVGSDYCTACDVGFYGYPSCRAISPDIAVNNPRCGHRQLPETLNTAAYLGQTAGFHLQDNYFIDRDHPEHVIDFEIHEDYAFRIYVESHVIDVDISLVQVSSQQGNEVVMGSGKWTNREESFFKILPGSASGVKYRLKFESYNYVPSLDGWECESMNLELAMSPMRFLSNEDTHMDCPENNKNLMPQIPDEVITVNDVYEYSTPPGSLLALVDTQDEETKEHAPVGRPLPRFFFSRKFKIPAQKNKQPRVYIEVGGRFLIGDMNVMIEAGHDGKHCGPRGPAQSDTVDADRQFCVVGNKKRNRSIIDRPLVAGDYTIWVYEPVPHEALKQLACAGFDFQIRITYEETSNSEFQCDSPRLPVSFNVPGYIDDQGVMHISEKYHLDAQSDTHKVIFNVYKDSSFRATVAKHRGNVQLKLYELDSSSKFKLVQNSGDEGDKFDAENIARDLDPGQYRLDLEYTPFSFLEGICHKVYLEVALAPHNLIAPPSCPKDREDVAPDLKELSTLKTLPYQFNSNKVYKAFNPAHWSDGVVAFFPIHIEHPDGVLFEVALSSYFLTGYMSVYLEVTQGDTPTVLEGHHRRNQNVLRAVVPPGDHTFFIKQMSAPTLATGSCTSYQLAVSVVEMKPNTVSQLCSIDTESLPESLNTVRFLGVQGTMHAQMNVMYPTRFVDDYVSEHTVFRVPRRSHLRVYVSKGHVAMDVSLSDGKKEVAVGLEEHVHIYLYADLEPNTEYTLMMTYLNVDGDVRVSRCDSYSLEIAVEVVREADHMACHNVHESHMPPPIPKVLPKTSSVTKVLYQYDSTFVGEDLYMLQDAAHPREYNFPFSLMVPASVYIRVGHQFHTGDVGVKISSTTIDSAEDAATQTQNDVSYYTTHKLNRNELRVKTLEPGNYTLSLYEPLQSSSRCAKFSYFITVESDATLFDTRVDTKAFFPADLNTIAFLSATGRMHIQDDYLIPQNDNMVGTSYLNIREPSLVRIYIEEHVLDIDVQILDEKEDMIAESVREGSTEDLLVHILQPGKYTMHLNFYDSNLPFLVHSLDGVTYNLEMAIAPIQEVTKELKSKTRQDDSGKCGGSDGSPEIPAIDLNRVGHYFHKGSYSFKVDGKDDNSAQSQSTIQTLHFVVEDNSVFEAELGYSFLVNDLMLNLVQTDGYGASDDPEMRALARRWTGSNRWNKNEIRDVIPPGRYDLEIVQPIRTLPSSELAHCADFDFSLYISQLTRAYEHGCNATSVMPLDLNTQDGGSVPFGGPLGDNGVLRFFGDSFLLPTENFVGRMSSVNLQVQEKSLMRILVVANSPNHAIEFGVTTKPDRDVKKPYHLFKSGAEVSGLFVLEPGKYALSFLYKNVDYSVACPKMDVTIIVMPFEAATHGLLCDKDKKDGFHAPIKDLRIDSEGFAQNALSTSIPASSIDNYVIKDYGFAFPLKFTVDQHSYLDASVDFDFLANFFSLELVAAAEDDSSVYYISAIGSPELTQDSRYSRMNFRRALHKDLPKGSYTLFLRQQMKEVLPNAFEGRDLCYPFITSINIGPANGNPYVRSVLPPSRQDVSPHEELFIDLMFSVELFGANKELTLSRDALAIELVEAFYLESRSGHELRPVSVYAHEKTVGFQLVFEDFHPGESYTLKLRDNVLYDKDGNKLVYTLNNVYDMAGQAACNNGGRKDSDGKCVCKKPYAGTYCNACVDGYVKKSSGCVKEKLKKDESKDDNSSNLRGCGSHGKRVDGKCVCEDGYKGAKCDECADGYDKSATSSRCILVHSPPPHVPPPAHHCGARMEADDDQNCVCRKEYSGTDCLDCAEGFQLVPDTNECVPQDRIVCSVKGVCGCEDPNAFECEPLGVCLAGEAGDRCKCNPGYVGSKCQRCASGYSGWPRCVHRDTNKNKKSVVTKKSKSQKLSCNGRCKRGYCDTLTGECVCPDHYAGYDCSICIDGFSGPDCMSRGVLSAIGIKDPAQEERVLEYMRLTSVGLGVGCLVVMIAIAAVRIYRRTRSPRTYDPVSINDDDGLGFSDNEDLGPEEIEPVQSAVKKTPKPKKDASGKKKKKKSTVDDELAAEWEERKAKKGGSSSKRKAAGKSTD